VPSRSNIFKKGSPTSGGLQFFELRRKRNSAGMLKAKHEPTDTEVIAQKILTSSFGTMWLSCDDNSLSFNNTEKRCKNIAPVQGQMEARVDHIVVSLDWRGRRKGK
jgi:hypothetical protein